MCVWGGEGGGGGLQEYKSPRMLKTYDERFPIYVENYVFGPKCSNRWTCIQRIFWWKKYLIFVKDYRIDQAEKTPTFGGNNLHTSAEITIHKAHSDRSSGGNIGLSGILQI